MNRRARPYPDRIDAPLDPDVVLLVPEADEEAPEVSVVVPSLNEESTISEFVRWCHEGLDRAAVRGEILIVDSSTDRTPTRALEQGARVLKTPRRGLGRAYIDALPYIRGNFVIMGDADCTYDFRELDRFVDAYRAGAEYAMGSRWRGTIEAGAMPALHRYLGTPATTWILNRVYGSHFSDIHCGMRGITRDALLRMGLKSQSWEYASEMVLKSVRMGLTTAEVPVRFYKDRTGRLSHHKRSGWTSPFKAAWINLRAMFVYGADFFLVKPGFLLFVVGLLLTVPLALGSVSVAGVTFNLYWMLIGVTVAVIGLESFYLGCVAQILCEYSKKSQRKWLSLFQYNRSIAVSIALILIGTGFLCNLLVSYLSNGMALPPPTAAVDHLAVVGILVLICGFSTFCFVLVIHATEVTYGSDAQRVGPSFSRLRNDRAEPDQLDMEHATAAIRSGEGK